MLSVTSTVIGNVKSMRNDLGISQLELAERSGVSYGSIKRFETKGDISLSSLIKIAIVLECEDDFKTLFSRKKYRSIEDVINDR